MKKPENSNFCYYPFMQILVTSEGKYRPCSKHLDHITHEGKVLTTRNASIGEAWHSDYMKDMRKQFNSDKQFAGCGECWRLQKIGLKSMRYDSYQYSVSDKQVENPEAPIRVELNSSNFCNLKCRICYPTASTKWINEAKKLYGWHESLHKNLEDDNLNQVLAWAENLEELCFFGGEPLLSKENLNLMRFLIEKGYAQNIKLLFNTNGTVFNDEIVELICEFKHVRMYFSIDDIGQRFEYQRKGAKWDEVVVNIKKAYELTNSEKGKNVNFKICNTVSIFNIYYYPEFFKFFNDAFPGLQVFWNLIFDPWEFNIQILPKEVKEIITYRLRNLITTSYELNEEDNKTIDNLVQYLNYEVEKPFHKFFNLVNRHDVFRAESFQKVFPEFWELIKQYAPEDLNFGSFDAQDLAVQAMMAKPKDYEFFSFIQNVRADWPFLKEKEQLDFNIIIDNTIGALNEIHKKLTPTQDFDAQLNALETLLNEEACSLFDFYEDFFVFGPFKFYRALLEMDAKEIRTLILQKYPKFESLTKI